MTILALRPEPGLSATLARGRDMGLSILGCPLFEVAPTAWHVPETAVFDALLVGSGNAFRHGGSDLAALRTLLPVHAVGEATAEAARELGFTVARVGSGGLQTVVDAAAAGTRFLRLTGSERVDLDDRGRVTIAERTVYATRAVPLEPRGAAALRQGGALALLHSAAAARHLAEEVDRLGIDRGRVALACLGPRIAEAAGRGWRRVESAAQPHDTALLALARAMCH